MGSGLLLLLMLAAAPAQAQPADEAQHRPPRLTVGTGLGFFFSSVDGLREQYVEEPLFSGHAALRLWRPHPAASLYATAQLHRFVATRRGADLVRWEATAFHGGLRAAWLDRRRTRTMVWAGGGVARYDARERSFREEREIFFEDRCGCFRETIEQIIDEEPLGATGAFVEVGQEAHYRPPTFFLAPGLFWTVRYDAVRRDGRAIGGWSAIVGATLSL